RIELDIVDARAPIAATAMVTGSTLQYGDDSDAQPSAAKIVVRPSKRLLAGFDNELFVRVTDDNGAPWVGRIEVVWLDGELMGQRRDGDPPKLFDAPLDRLGLARLVGRLDSEVVRLEVRAYPSGSEVASATRKLRFVSFAGGVDVAIDPSITPAGNEVDVR